MLLYPMLDRLLDLWKRFAQALGRMNSLVLLAVVFLAVITPVGLLFRAFGKSPLSRKAAGTNWTERSGESRLDRPF